MHQQTIRALPYRLVVKQVEIAWLVRRGVWQHLGGWQVVKARGLCTGTGSAAVMWEHILRPWQHDI